MREMSEIIKWISDAVLHKSKHYRIQPVDYMPMDWLLAQVGIKAMRAYEVTNPRKREDELKDLIIYSMYALKRTQESLDVMVESPYIAPAMNYDQRNSLSTQAANNFYNKWMRNGGRNS